MHAGQPKTGSSTIQRFLNNNKKTLQKYGYLYETGKAVNHQLILRKIFSHDDPHNAFNTFMDDQITIAKQKSCEHIIISHEGLFFLQEALVSSITKRFSEDMRLHVFLRRQDFYLESAWKQWHFKNTHYKDFDDYARTFKIPNYLFHLEKWSKFIPKKSIHVTPFEKRNFPEGIERHFLNSIGILDTSAMDLSVVNDGWGANKGLTSEGLALAFLVRDIADNNIHDHSIQYFINEHFRSLQKEHFVSYDLLSLERRQEILTQSMITNQKIVENFTNRSGPLFEDEIESLPLKTFTEEDIDYTFFVGELMRIGIRQDALIKELKSKIKRAKKALDEA